MKNKFHSAKWCQICSALIGILAFHMFFIFPGCSKEKKPFIIGYVGTLSGKGSTDGLSTRNAIVMAVDEINKAGGINGRTVKLIIRDDKQDINLVRTVDGELINEGVSVIIGHTLSSTTMAALPYINEKNIMMISPTAASSKLSGIDDNLIKLSVSVDKRARILAGVALKELSLAKIAAVYDVSNEKYSKSYYDNFSKEYRQAGGRSIAIPFDPSRDDTGSVINKVLHSGIDGVLLIVPAMHGAVMCQHLRKADPDITIIDSSWASTDPSFVKNAGRAAEGVVTVMQYNEDTTGKAFTDLKKAYENWFEERISQDALFGYEAVKVVFSALSINDDPGRLKETILKQKVFKGVDGDIIIDKFGDSTRPLYIVSIQNGKLKITGKTL